MFRLSILFLLTVLVLGPTFLVSPLKAQTETLDEGLRIALVVNNTAKTLYDLEKRLRLVVSLSGGEVFQSERNSLLALVRDQLVDEIIKRDQSLESGLRLDEAVLEESFTNLIINLGIRRDELNTWLNNRGLLFEDLREMLENQALWALYQGQFLSQNIVVSRAEIEKEMGRLKNRGRRTLLRQITINYNRDNKQKKMSRIEAIRNRLLEGSSFSVMAKNFSEDQYAIDGGIVGWVNEKNLSENLRKELAKLENEQTSNILKEEDRLLIIRVEDRQENHELSEEEVRQQLFLEKLGVWVKKQTMVLRENAYIDIRY